MVWLIKQWNNFKLDKKTTTQDWSHNSLHWVVTGACQEAILMEETMKQNGFIQEKCNI